MKSQVNVLLEMKLWRLRYTESEIQIAIAESLNSTVVETGIPIKGYLITNWRIYIILDVDEDRKAEFLHCFEEHVSHHLKPGDRLKKDEGNSYRKLFLVLPFFDDDMMKLLTGKKVELEYYSPYLARLKDFLNTYNYCSVPDYSGSIGPVFVNQLS